ncbi:hypothetical protein NQ317_019294 [Molorchus minor]|uniref:Transposase n=1 Tax=Molorchus minor TaxID=1323400 RepID=A0ABQ9J6V2_9CUCU|nr:hypothetical protein NQ317_019294 [Molorchus minor]
MNLSRSQGAMANNNNSHPFLVQEPRVGPMIRKKDTKWRKGIPTNERLAITLRFLATGDSFKSLHYLFNISPHLISGIVPEVCSAFFAVLQDYVKLKNFEENFLTLFIKEIKSNIIGN